MNDHDPRNFNPDADAPSSSWEVSRGKVIFTSVRRKLNICMRTGHIFRTITIDSRREGFLARCAKV
jgi:hypothetical protein